MRELAMDGIGCGRPDATGYTSALMEARDICIHWARVSLDVLLSGFRTGTVSLILSLSTWCVVYTGLGISSETYVFLTRFVVFRYCALGAKPILPDFHLPRQTRAD